MITIFVRLFDNNQSRQIRRLFYYLASSTYVLPARANSTPALLYALLSKTLTAAGCRWYNL